MYSTIDAALAGTITIGDKTINRLGYGAMRITGDGIWGEPKDLDEAQNVLRGAVELGVNFIDTADAYGPEVSEILIQKALQPYTGLLIATKGGLTRGGPGQWTPDCSPKHLRQAIEGILRRLGVEQIDLYQLHTVDPAVPFADSFGALCDLQAEGKINTIGLSNINPDNFEEAVSIGPFGSVQNNYNVTNREHEAVLQLCEQHGVAFIPYFPIGGNQSGGLAHELLSKIAEAHEATERQVGLVWLLAHSPVMLPIPGTASLVHLSENIAAASLKLSAEDIAALDRIGAESVSN